MTAAKTPTKKTKSTKSAKIKVKKIQEEDLVDEEFLEDLNARTQYPPTGGRKQVYETDEGIASYEPDEGWMPWELNMYMDGRVHQTVNAISTHTVVYELEPVDESKPAVESSDFCNNINSQFGLPAMLRTTLSHAIAFGFGAMYPVYERKPLPDGTYEYGDLTKIKIIDPTNLRILRDNPDDIEFMLEYFPRVSPKMVKMGKKEVRPNNTGRIIGFVVSLNISDTNVVTDSNRKEVEPEPYSRNEPNEDEVSEDGTKIFYYDDELILLFREASGLYPDGISLLRANYTILENKHTLDWVAVAGYAKSVVPTWIVQGPTSAKSKAAKIRYELMRSRSEPGSDIIILGNEELNINRTIADGLSSAQPLLDYYEKQYLSAFGVFDSMWNSASSNRATAAIQSDLFQRMIEPFRRDIEKIINKRLFAPMLERHFKASETPGSEPILPSVLPDTPEEVAPVDEQNKPYVLPTWSWGALIEQDKIDFLSAFTPFVNMMAPNQIEFVLTKYGGLPKAEGEPAGVEAQKKALEQVRMTMPLGKEKGTQPPQPPQEAPPEGLQQLEDLDVRTMDERRKEIGLPPLPGGRGKFVPIPQYYLVL